MQIHGFQKLTLLDFPGKVAATVFTGNCNFRCPFCHNMDLVLHPNDVPEISADEVFSTLKKRKGILEGVAITGGEPTLQKDLPEFIRSVKDLGYAVKLDTNGYRPDILEEILNDGLVDYVAMDIKSSRTGYARVANIPNLDLSLIDRSIRLLMSGEIPYEFRTTVVRELHTADDFRDIGNWISGCSAYFLQSFKDSDQVVVDGLSAYSKEELQELIKILQPHIANVQLRGID